MGVLFLRIASDRIQLSFREEYSQICAPKVSLSALRPGITNLAFQQFRLLAALLEEKMALLEWKMALLEWKMAIRLGSMAARNGSPTLYREPCQPSRMCTS